MESSGIIHYTAVPGGTPGWPPAVGSSAADRSAQSDIIHMLEFQWICFG